MRYTTRSKIIYSTVKSMKKPSKAIQRLCIKEMIKEFKLNQHNPEFE